METLQYLNAGAYESLTPGDTATGITAAIKQPTSGAFKNLPAIGALITVENNSARFTMDGTTPTASVGHLITAGQSYVITGAASVSAFKCIDAVSGVASNIKVTTFFKNT